MRVKTLNRRLLRSHHLSDRLRGRAAPMRVAGACCGIQSQSLSESLGSFWARIDRFRDSDVLSKLRPGGGLVRTWAIRSAMHTIPSKDYHTYLLGGASGRMLKWLDTIAKKRRYPPREERMRLLYEPVLDEIRGKSVTGEELETLVNAMARRSGLRRRVWSGLGEMAFSGLLVHAGKRGPRSLWMRSDDWIPGLGRPPDPAACRRELLRKYIATHGPVSRDDIAYWAYLSKEQVDQALDDLAGELVDVKVENSKEPYIALDEDMREIPPPPTAIVLPRYDSLLLSLKDKSRFMDMADYKRIFPRIPVGMIEATVLVDGVVAATWRRVGKKASPSIEVHPFRTLMSKEKSAIRERFAEYCDYAGVEAQVRWA